MIVSTNTPEEVAKFGEDMPTGRVGQLAKLGPADVSLALANASYFTGQVIHANGDEEFNS